MAKVKLLLFLFLAIVADRASATTWDEPWAEKVVSEADFFVLAKVSASDEKKGVTLEVLKSLGGQLRGKVKITDFYLLDLCSSSAGHGPEFHFRKGENYYFFLKKNKGRTYSIATPTTGFARIKDGKVSATYRHSYHQAMVPAETYEKTMTAIFNKYHNLPYDAQYVQDYVTQYLSLKPAGFKESEIATFFAQHVALESIYHLRLPGFSDQVIPFLNDTSNFHNQVSAARALSTCNTSRCKAELVQVIADTTRDSFVQAICVLALAELKPTELKGRLTAIKETASTKHNGFGGNIMDPRVCTDIPDVKSALEKLIGTL